MTGLDLFERLGEWVSALFAVWACVLVVVIAIVVLNGGHPNGSTK
jgi:hypothetical protein